MKSKSLWQISVATLVEAEESVTDLFARVFRQSPALYTNEETLVTTVTVYGSERTIRSGRRRAALAAGLQAIRAGGLPVGPAKISVKKVRQPANPPPAQRDGARSEWRAPNHTPSRS